MTETDKQKILIVDDDRVLSKVIKDGILAKKGDMYDVTVAFDGEEGLKVAQEIFPALILLDIVMPKMGGIEFLEKLREDSRFIDTPIIIGTQVSDIEQMSKAVTLGVKGYIIKAEFSVENIIKQVEEVLAKTGN
ncbi:MAG TPA: response regulator [Candidatus Yonathbacteria bacterium]|nr:response regulator [Candidatus Yonathbacteria bacterium]